MRENDKKTHPYNAQGAPRRDRTDTTLFTGFEEDDVYEEPDRDTDYTSAYREDILEDEEFADPLYEEDEPLEEEEWPDPLPDESPEEPRVALVSEDDGPWRVVESPEAAAEAETADMRSQPLEVVARQEQVSPEPPRDEFQAEEDDDWDDEDDYPEEEQQEQVRAAPTWPMGLIAVAVLALLLLVAGGYGIIQQRSATQEEIRQLQAALATSVDPAEASAAREALQGAEQRLTELQAVIDVLTLENRRLSDTVAGLEAQLTAQQDALAGVEESGKAETPEESPATAQPKAATRPEPQPEPKPEPATRVAAATPAPAKPAAAATSTAAAAAPAASPDPTAAGSGWFVNFASYGVRGTAEKWVGKLQPSAGRAVVSTASRDGRTFYRVRVIDLPDQAAADRVARELATKHALPKLWVGRE